MEDLEESERLWLRKMEEEKSSSEILSHLLELMHSSNLSKEKAEKEFGLLLKILPLQLVNSPVGKL